MKKIKLIIMAMLIIFTIRLMSINTQVECNWQCIESNGTIHATKKFCQGFPLILHMFSINDTKQIFGDLKVNPSKLFTGIIKGQMYINDMAKIQKCGQTTNNFSTHVHLATLDI